MKSQIGGSNSEANLDARPCALCKKPGPPSCEVTLFIGTKRGIRRRQSPFCSLGCMEDWVRRRSAQERKREYLEEVRARPAPTPPPPPLIPEEKLREARERVLEHLRSVFEADVRFHVERIEKAERQIRESRDWLMRNRAKRSYSD